MRIGITALCVLSGSIVMAAAPTASDPWAKVPKPPTACYLEHDKYNEELDAAVEAMNEEIARQDEVNNQIQAQMDNLDPMELQSRMQTYLMQNPQEAAKMMQAAQAQGTAAEADINNDVRNEQVLQDELKEIQAGYDAALDKLIGPLYARLKALGISESGTDQKTVEAGMVLAKRINAEYEGFCPQWWGGSPFNEWLKRYKEHLIKNHVPYLDARETAKTVQWKMFGIPSDKFHSTVLMESVVTYMKQTRAIFDNRLWKPREDLVMPP